MGRDSVEETASGAERKGHLACQPLRSETGLGIGGISDGGALLCFFRKYTLSFTNYRNRHASRALHPLSHLNPL
jgi:hypothetical protein